MAAFKSTWRNTADNVNWTAADVANPHAVCPSGDEGDKGLSKLVSAIGVSGVAISRAGDGTNEGPGCRSGKVLLAAGEVGEDLEPLGAIGGRAARRAASGAGGVQGLQCAAKVSRASTAYLVDRLVT